LVPVVSVANELAAQPWLAFALAVQHTFRNPPPSSAPPE